MATASAADAQLPRFKKLELTDQYWSESTELADINRDGKMDLISGAFWYEGPSFKTRHAYGNATASFKLKKADGSQVSVPGFEGGLGVENAYTDNFMQFAHDFNGDGWLDLLTLPMMGEQAFWYENPKGKDGPWPKHIAFNDVSNESPTFKDLTGDGKPELICNHDGYFGYASPDPANPSALWKFHPITTKEGWEKFTHGLGIGDINGDGRKDLIEAGGWWEQPASLAGDPAWTRHKADFAKGGEGHGGAQYHAYDVNGDGLVDVIGSLDAHGYGLAWFEQTRSAGKIGFERHIILEGEATQNAKGVQFSQLHGVAVVDIDGDGLKDIVTGKRYLAHGRDGDPEPLAAPVLYWFKLARDGKQVSFVPHLIDDASGIGVDVLVADANGDGRADILTANKKGVFIQLRQ